MTKPPIDLLVWYAIHRLGMRTEKPSFSQLRGYLVPNLMTLKELLEALKRGEDFGIVRKNYYMDGKEMKYWLELGSYTSMPSQELDMFGSLILRTLAYKEAERKKVIYIEPLKCLKCGRERQIGVETISRGLPRTYYLPCECEKE